jgi:hypothetical protein
MVSGNTIKFLELLPRYRDVLGYLATPAAGNRVGGMVAAGLPWAADNGAFKGFDPGCFRRFLAKIAGRKGCCFLAVPDVVCDAAATLARFREWEAECRATGHPLALVAQNGLTSAAVPWDRIDALFIGGDDAFKEGLQAFALAWAAKCRRKWLHMGRVNSARRMRLARSWGCDSVDGTGMSRFGDLRLGKMLRWRREIEGEAREPTLFESGAITHE